MFGANCFNNNTQIGPKSSGLTIDDFYTSLIAQASCAPPSYIRPDDAGSFLPWPYTLAWFLVHFPVTLIRVHRWERVQALSIILAILTMGFQLQAYISSVEPEAVLVWMPIFTVLDIGAMMQLAFLIIEESGYPPLVHALGTIFLFRPCSPKYRNASELGIQPFVALLALILGLALLVLQLYGLVIAIRGDQRDDITAVWCSTLFADALAVQSSCSLYIVEASFSRGIGCIRLRGYEQYTWLKATTIIVSISLVFEIIDCVVLSLVNGSTRWRGAKMKRPWFTMFTGNLVLVVVIVIGVFQSQNLPKTVSETVTIYKYEPSLRLATACMGELTPYGVRGAIIGWTDGFLKSWGEAYAPTHN